MSLRGMMTILPIQRCSSSVKASRKTSKKRRKIGFGRLFVKELKFPNLRFR